MWPLRSESKARRGKKRKLQFTQEEHTKSRRFIDEFLTLRLWQKRSRLEVEAEKG